MQISHIRDGIHDTTRTKNVGVLGKECGADNASFVFTRFEVRVGEEEEEGVELVFFEVVWEVFHGVGTENSNVLVRTGSRGIGTVIVVIVVVVGGFWRRGEGRLNTEGGYSVLNVVCYLHADLHAYIYDTITIVIVVWR